jgi:hypothetical protein
MKRPHIEVDNYITFDSKHPIQSFVNNIRYPQDIDITVGLLDENLLLLQNLIARGHIAKSSIIWDGERITRIYGLSIDNNGRIRYERAQHYPERIDTVGTQVGPLDLLSLRRAVIRENNGVPARGDNLTPTSTLTFPSEQ